MFSNLLKILFQWVGSWFKKPLEQEIKTMQTPNSPSVPSAWAIPEEPTETNTEKLYRIADVLAQLEEDITPEDLTEDEVACVENLCEVINRVVEFPRLKYTPYLVTELKEDPRFKGTLDCKEGYIIVNATESGNGTVRGHCGVIGKGGKIMSGNSYNGKWEYNYTLDSWKQNFRIEGGMVTWVFRLLD